MTTFNAGAIEANLTLDRSSWDIDYREVLAQAERLEALSITIGIDADTINADIAIDNLEKNLDLLDKDPVNIEIDADTTRAEAAIEQFKGQLATLNDEGVAINVDTDAAITKLVQLSAILDSIPDQINIAVDVDAAAAATELTAFEAQVAAIDGNDINVKVDVDRKPLQQLETTIGSLVGGGGSGGGGGGGGSMGLLKLAIMAIIGLSPVLSGAIIAVVGVLVAFGGALTAAAGGVGLLMLGIIGLYAQYKKLKKAGDPLPPMFKEFDKAIQVLHKTWTAWLKSIEPAALSLMTDTFGFLADLLPKLTPIFNAVAGAASGLIDDLDNWVNSPAFNVFVHFFQTMGPKMITAFGHILGNLGTFFINLFDAASPLITWLMGSIVDLTGRWADWSKTLDHSKSFQNFMDLVREYGPRVMDLINSIWDALLNLGKALLPFAGPMLDHLTGFFNFIANIPPNVLTPIIAGLVALWGAFQLAGPAMTLVTLAMDPVFWIVAAVVLAIAGLAFVIYKLWTTNKEFRDNVTAAWERIKEQVGIAVNNIKGFLQDHKKDVADLKDVWEQLKKTVADIVMLILAIVEKWVTIFNNIWAKWGHHISSVVGQTFHNIMSIIKGVLQVIQGVVQIFTGLLTGDWSKMGQGIVNVTKGMWNIAKGLFNQAKVALLNIAFLIWQGVKAKWQLLWNNIKTAATAGKAFIVGVFNALVSFMTSIPGRIAGALSNMWNGMVSSLSGVITKIRGMLSSLSFKIDIPDIVPGLPSSLTISAHPFAEGGFIGANHPILGVIGEGGEDEIVSPVPKLTQLIRENSAEIDYGRMAQEITAAMTSTLAKSQGTISRDEIAALMSRAGINLKVDASLSESEMIRAMVTALSFELRRMGFGGKRYVGSE